MANRTSTLNHATICALIASTLLYSQSLNAQRSTEWKALGSVAENAQIKSFESCGNGRLLVSAFDGGNVASSIHLSMDNGSTWRIIYVDSSRFHPDPDSLMLAPEIVAAHCLSTEQIVSLAKNSLVRFVAESGRVVDSIAIGIDGDERIGKGASFTGDSGVVVVGGVPGAQIPDELYSVSAGGIAAPIPAAGFRTEDWSVGPIDAVAFPGPERVVVIVLGVGGRELLAVTQDLGRSWILHRDPLDTGNVGNHSLSFINRDTGYLGGSVVADFSQDTVGREARLWKTEDGGKTWAPVFAGFIDRNPLSGFTQIAFGSDSVGVAAGGRFLFHTFDGGASWTSSTSEFNSGMRVVAASSDTFVAVSQSGEVFRYRVDGTGSAVIHESYGRRLDLE